MLEILVSYLYTFFIAIGMGLVFTKWIKLENYNILFTILIGFFSQLIIATFYALFFPLNSYFYVLNTVMSLTLIIVHVSTVKRLFQNAKKTLFEFSTSSRVLFFGVVVLSLIYSSSLPFLADNESYYIQTIKWLNNYGIVKGIFNLHLFFGQFSGWHILQSGFNFGFLSSHLNDLNGFLIIVVSFFCVEKWEAYKKNENKIDLFVSLIFCAVLFLFLFIGSPSPDLPILLIVPMIFYLFIAFMNDSNLKDHAKIISILSLLIILIKVAIFPILILLLIVSIRIRNTKYWGMITLLSFVALVSFIYKNIIVSGYPLYPLTNGSGLVDVDWKISHDLQALYNRLTAMSGWKMYDWEAFGNLNFFEKFLVWLNLPKVSGVMNKVILFLVILFPLLYRKKKVIRYLSVYVLIHFVIFYLTSPQYRYFAPVLLSIALILGVEILHKKMLLIKSFIFLNLITLLWIGVFGLEFNGVTDSNIMKTKYSLVPSQIISPRAITQFENVEFKQYEMGNLKYFSPVVDSSYFYQTFDGPLPCVNKDMIDYFSTYYDHIPQMRSSDMKDGFKSGNPESENRGKQTFIK